MDWSANMLTALITAGLIVLGWLLGEFSSLFRSWRESRKTLKAVLFYLMEFHHYFGFLDLNWFYDIFLQKLGKKYPGAVDETEEEAIRKFLTPMIFGFVKEISGDELSRLKPNYQKSVEKLAEISPFHAFYLSGKAMIFDFSDALQELLAQAGDLQQNLEDAEASKKFRRFFEDKTCSEIKKELESGLKGIARRIGPIAYLKTLRYLDRAKRKRPMQIEKEIDEYLDSIPRILSDL